MSARFWRQYLAAGDGTRLASALGFVPTGLHRSIERPLSDAAHGVLSQAQEDPQVVLIAAVVCLVQRYTSEPRVWLSLLSPPGSPTHSLPLSVSAAPDRARATLLQGARRGRDAVVAHAGQATPGAEPFAPTGTSDVGVWHGPHAPDPCGQTLRVGLLQDGAPRLQVQSDQGLPTWFLEETAAVIERIVVQLGVTEAPVQGVALLSPEAQAATLALGIGAPQHADRALPDLFDAIVRSGPDRIALSAGDQHTSYAALQDQVRRAASLLVHELAITAGQVVGVLVARTPWDVVAMLALAEIGAVFLPVSRQHPTARRSELLASAGAHALLSSSACVAQLLEHPDLPCVALDLQLPAEARELPPRPGPADVAYIIHTSGSSGQPKAVAVSHGAMANVALAHVEALAMAPDDRYLRFMAPSFDGSLLDAWTALLSGASLVLPSDDDLEDPEHLAALMLRTRVTITTMTPSYLALMPPEVLRGLRALVSAGEAAHADELRRLARHVRVFNGYGPTEAAVNATLHEIDPGSTGPHLPIGRATRGKQVCVLDPGLRILPCGVVGELCVGGAISEGYVDTQDPGDPRFVPSPHPPASLLYRTGDRASLDPDGTVWFWGRGGDQTKINGFRVGHGEVRATVCAQPGVRDAIVTANTDGGRARLVCFYVPDAPGAGPEPQVLRRALTAQLPSYMVPSRTIRVAHLPMTSHGKVDVAALLASAPEPGPEEGQTIRPQTEPQRALARAWAQVLGRDDLGIHDDFFALGGDSIEAIRVVQVARDAGLQLQAADVIAHPTIAGLAELLQQARPAPTAELPEPLLTDAARALVPPDVQIALPASATQRIMAEAYLEDAGRTGCYHCNALWRISDPRLDPSALIAALHALIEAHDSLRTQLIRGPEPGSWLHVVHPEHHPQIPLEPLPDPGEGGLEPLLRELLDRDVLDRFRPEVPAPWSRFRVWLASPQLAYVQIAFHHAVLDGWSGAILQRALLQRYLSPGVPAEPVEPGSPMAEAIVRQERAAPEPPPAPEAPRLSSVGEASGGPRSASVRFDAAQTHAIHQRAQHSGVGLRAWALWCLFGALERDIEGAEPIVAVVSSRRAAGAASLEATGLFWSFSLVDRPPQVLPAALQAHLHEAEGQPVPSLRLPVGFVPSFNYVRIPEGADRSGVVLEPCAFTDRFHLPLGLTVSLDEGPGQLSGRLEWDAARVGPRVAEAILGRWSEQMLS